MNGGNLAPAPEAPPRLAALQARFAAAIREPLSFDAGKFACRTEAYPAGAAEAVAPRPGGSPRARLAVYNQQYWYRLLNLMQEDFPLLAATLGPWEFNRLASGYLSARPSRSRFLDRLAEGFPGYVEALPDRPRRVKDIARLETFRLYVFHAPRRAPLDPARLSETDRAGLAARPLEFQPWLRLFAETEDLVANRRLLEANPGTRPEFRAEAGYWALSRSEGRVDFRRLDGDQYRVLSALAAGASLESACAQAAEADAEAPERLAAGLPGWFATWTREGWFAHPGSEPLLGWEA